MLLHIFNVTSISEILTPQSLVARKERRNTKLKLGEWAIREKSIYIYWRATVHIEYLVDINLNG